MVVLLWVLLSSAQLFAQSASSDCGLTTQWTPCDFVFNLQTGDNAAPQLRAEFRSPHHRTFPMQAFRNATGSLVIRFAPTEAGSWEYRLTSNLSRLDGQTGQFVASQADGPGFVHVANVHHFATDDGKPHLWMATAIDRFAAIPRAEFDQLVAQRAKEKFSHLRVTLEAGADLREAADRIRAINVAGMIADLALAAIPEERPQRESYLSDVIPRFAAFNITWMGFPAFESVTHGRAVLKDAGALIQKLDPYGHPRTTMASSTSAPLATDGWMNFLSYGTSDANIGAVEHQLFQTPAVNTGIHSQRDLWNATMNGQYPDSGSGQYMTAWFEFMSGNRYWELEPYFDVDGGRAIALEGVEYLVYVDKSGPVELTVEDHGYDVAWINPATGERIKDKKGYKGQHFTGEPPDKSHDWVLQVSRESHKEGMLKSYKFESRAVPVQISEQDPAKIPFDIAEPSISEVSLSHSAHYALRITRQTRATRSLLVEWTGEAVIDGEGYRVVGSGKDGTLQIPSSIIHAFPCVFSLRMAVLNANGKAYIVDKVLRLVP